MPFYQGTTTSANLMNELLSKITAVQPGETEPWWINESTDPNHVVLTSRGSSGNARIVVWMTPYPQYGFIRVRIARDYIPGAVGELGIIVDDVPYHRPTSVRWNPRRYGPDDKLALTYYACAYEIISSNADQPIDDSAFSPIPVWLPVSYCCAITKDAFLIGLWGDSSYYGQAAQDYIMGSASDVVYVGATKMGVGNSEYNICIASSCNVERCRWAGAGIDDYFYEITRPCAIGNKLGPGRVENYYDLSITDMLPQLTSNQPVVLFPIGIYHPVEGYCGMLDGVYVMPNCDGVLRHGDEIDVCGMKYMAFKKIRYNSSGYFGALDKTGWLAIRKS